MSKPTRPGPGSASRGFDAVVEERDCRDELMRTGFAGPASENHTHWAHLSLRDPDFVGRDYGSGKPADDAVIRARRRYGSEQAYPGTAVQGPPNAHARCSPTSQGDTYRTAVMMQVAGVAGW